jgi:hypothetical protein
LGEKYRAGTWSFVVRKILINVQDSGFVDVKFVGGHISKRELLRVLKALKIGYRERIREYRKIQRSYLDKKSEVSEDVGRQEGKTGQAGIDSKGARVDDSVGAVKEVGERAVAAGEGTKVSGGTAKGAEGAGKASGGSQPSQVAQG